MPFKLVPCKLSNACDGALFTLSTHQPALSFPRAMSAVWRLIQRPECRVWVDSCLSSLAAQMTAIRLEPNRVPRLKVAICSGTSGGFGKSTNYDQQVGTSRCRTSVLAS